RMLCGHADERRGCQSQDGPLRRSDTQAIARRPSAPEQQNRERPGPEDPPEAAEDAKLGKLVAIPALRVIGGLRGEAGTVGGVGQQRVKPADSNADERMFSDEPHGGEAESVAAP